MNIQFEEVPDEMPHFMPAGLDFTIEAGIIKYVSMRFSLPLPCNHETKRAAEATGEDPAAFVARAVQIGTIIPKDGY